MQRMLNVEAPEIVDEDSAKIKIITNDENVIYLNEEIIKLDRNKEYEVKLPKQENRFRICVKGKTGLVTYKHFTINRDSSKIYLNLEYDKNVNRNRVKIRGETQKDNRVTINGKKIVVSREGEFNYTYYRLNQGKNILTLVAKNEDTDEVIDKEIKIYFNKPNDYDSDKDEVKDGLLDIVETISDTADEDAVPPVINLDTEIPETTNKKAITISGTCENANTICILGGKSRSKKFKLDSSKRFSYTLDLCTGDNYQLEQSEKGMRNFIQIWAVNKDKITVKEYFIYYKEKD